MSNINRGYVFGDNGDTLTEVGIASPHGGEVRKVKFGTPIKVFPDEPVWVALGRRIVELENEVAWIDSKAREYGYSGLAFVIQNRGDRPIKDFEENAND